MKTVILLLFPFFLVGQNSVCNFQTWGNAGTTAIIDQYLLHDSCMLRMKVSSVKLALISDSASAGISMRNTNDPTAMNIQLYRFRSNGQLANIFDNTLNSGNAFFKTQLIYNEQLVVIQKIFFQKDPGAEFDTAWHMKGFELISSYKGFTITKGYEGNQFSNAPKTPPLYTTTETYDDKGRKKWIKTIFSNDQSFNDSTAFSYPDLLSQVEKYYHSGALLWTITRKFQSGSSGIISETWEQKNDENKMYAYTIAYTYDSFGRLTSVNNSMTKERSEVRYNADGTPKLLLYTTGGQICMLSFYYTYYK